jgi:hypothetical protein
MKRLATATVVLTALATVAQAGGLPKPVSLVSRMKMYDITHYTRGAEAGSSHGNSSESEAPPAEARKHTKAPKTAQKQKPQPAKAD